MTNCKHTNMAGNVRRQFALNEALLIDDCAECGTTLTVGRDAHTFEEGVKAMKLRLDALERRAAKLGVSVNALIDATADLRAAHPEVFPDSINHV